MGMVMGLRTLSDANVERVLADPPLIWKVLAPDDPERYEDARRRPSGCLARIFGLAKQPEQTSEPASLVNEDDVVEADLDKSWHGIHYLLTQTAWKGEEPLNFLVSGGKEVGNIDVGYGPARVLTSAQVRRVRDALAGFDQDSLRSRFNPAEMMALQIYPEIWDRDPEDDDTYGYCEENFLVLKAFVEDAVQRNAGIVVYVT